MAENPVNHKVSHHIDTCMHYIGELVGLEQVTLTPCQTDKMVADYGITPDKSSGSQRKSSYGAKTKF